MKYFGWIFLFFIMLYIVPLGSRPMLFPTEFDHAAIAKEMVETGSYATVMINGDAAAEIPPMAYWLTAGSFKLFGVNNFAARLPSALAAGITALLIALLVRQHLRDEKLAALTATVYLSFLLVLFIGSISQVTMIFIMAVTGTLGTTFLAVQEPKFNRRKLLLLVLSGLSAGLGFLTDGMPALVLPLLVIIPYLVISGKLKELLYILPITLICAAIPVTPWLMQMTLEPETFDRFFSFTAFKESIGTLPWYLYILELAAGTFPVWILLPAALMTGRESWKKMFHQDLSQFAGCLLIMPMLYFLIFRNGYGSTLLISFPAIALITAMGLQAYFNNGGHHRSFDWMLNIWALLLLICGLTSVILWFIPGAVQVCFKYLPLDQVVLLVWGVTALIGGSVLLYSKGGSWRSRLYLFFFTVAILPLGFSWCLRPCAIMPEETVTSLIEETCIIPAKSVIYTDAELLPLVSWCADKNIVIRDIGEFNAKDLTDKDNTVCIIKTSEDPAWMTLPVADCLKTRGIFTCAVYPAANQESTR
ncbi:MAG: glycosyltransferase family 39 protein [Lentisphaeria bacterium]|nr:glycosyltransferase family 39 protein [Lentisphaeria bacterium]